MISVNIKKPRNTCLKALCRKFLVLENSSFPIFFLLYEISK